MKRIECRKIHNYLFFFLCRLAILRELAAKRASCLNVELRECSARLIQAAVVWPPQWRLNFPGCFTAPCIHLAIEDFRPMAPSDRKVSITGGGTQGL